MNQTLNAVYVLNKLMKRKCFRIGDAESLLTLLSPYMTQYMVIDILKENINSSLRYYGTDKNFTELAGDGHDCSFP